MKKENVKYFVLPILMIAGYAIWYYWNKSKQAAAVIAGTSSTTATLKSATIADSTTPGAVKQYSYPYGDGTFIIERLAPSTYKTPEALNFTSALNSRSAFRN